MEARLKTHHKLLIAALVVLTATLLLVAGVYAYDKAQEDQIAPGVSIGGVDVGGRSADEARAVIEDEIVAPLQKPVEVTYDGETYRLSSTRLDQTADVDGMVDEAVAASRDGNLVDRVSRYVQGSEVDVDLDPQVSYSEDAVDAFVGEVADRGQPGPGGREHRAQRPSRSSPRGASRASRCARTSCTKLVTRQVESPGVEKDIEASVRRVAPEVTTKELASVYPTYITVDQSAYTLRLFVNLKLVKSYGVAVGGGGYATPTGLHSIQDKQVDPTWNVPDLELGRRPRRPVDPTRPLEPAEGALDGHLRRRRHSRHRRHRLDRQRGVARLCADDDRGRRPTSSTASTSARRSTSSSRRAFARRMKAAPGESIPMPEDENSADALGDAWKRALGLFDRELSARAVAEGTRRAYSTDLGQLALWADGLGMEPERLGHRDLRRFAAHLSSGGASKATVARKLAAIRSFYEALLRTESVSANPADLVASPKRDQKLPRVLSRDEMASLLDRIPARTPLELRDRAMLELTYSCGLRAQEVIDLDIDLDRLRRRARAGRGQGRQDPHGARRRARTARAPRLPGARPPRARRDAAPRRPCSSPRAGAGCTPPTFGGASSAGSTRPRSPAASRPTRCATPSPRTCSRAGRTCERSRSCSVTRASRPRRSTREWSRPGSGLSTLGAIRVPEKARNCRQETS